MRILVTSLGETTMKDLEKNFSFNNNNSNIISNNNSIKTFHNVNRLKKKYSINKINHRNQIKNVNYHNNNYYNQNNFLFNNFSSTNYNINNKKYFSNNNSKINISNNNNKNINNKKITIKLRKYFFPKEISDNYNNIKTSENIISNPIKNLPEIKEALNNKKSIQSISTIKNFSLKEILGKEAVYKIKKNTIKEEKNKQIVLTENDFRSEYKNLTKLEEIENILYNKKINKNKTNLIKYINSNKNIISNLSLKNISKLNDEKINKINKVCQNVLDNNIKYNRLINEIKSKIKQINFNDSVQGNFTLKNMINEIKIGNKIFKKYDKYNNNNESAKEVYKDKKKDYEKIWKKYHIEKLYQRKNLNDNNYNNFNLNEI